MTPTAKLCREPNCRTLTLGSYCHLHRKPDGWVARAVREEERGGSFLDEPHADRPTALFEDFSDEKVKATSN